jgi:type I restriction enzyme S subunit
VEEFNVVIDTAQGLSELRSLILGLAVRGKLVPQDPNDEPASELLKKIEAEKQRLYEEGEIRKPKELPPISSIDKLFEIPTGWKWVRNGDLIIFQNGYAFKSSLFQESGVGIIRIGDLQSGKVVEDTMKFISEEKAIGVKNDYLIKQGDLLIAMSGATTGKLAVNYSKNNYFLNQRVGKIEPLLISQEYLHRYLNTKIEENLSISMGSAIPNLSTKQIEEIEVPLPPLKEQHRIVTKIESLFAEVDELEALLEEQTKLDDKLQLAVNAEVQQAQDAKASKVVWNIITSSFDTLYHTPESIDNLKKNILNEAVRGRLVPQDPNDEPASELLKKIEAEKQRLYEEGEIRKPKKLPPVTEDEIPFEIPKSWEWQHIEGIFDVGTGSTPATSESKYYLGGTIPWFTSSATNNLFTGKADKFITELALKETNCKVFPTGSLIIALYGQGKTRGQVSELSTDGATNQAIAALVSVFDDHNEPLKKYTKLFFLKIYTEIRELAEGGAQPNLNVGKIKKTLMPLPPLKEQHRIVRRIEELVTICDEYKAKLEQHEKVNERLVKGLVQEVLEGV